MIELGDGPYVMVSLPNREVQEFKQYYLKHMGKKRFKQDMMEKHKDGDGVNYLDQDGKIVFLEMNRMGGKIYLVNEGWYEYFQEDKEG